MEKLDPKQARGKTPLTALFLAFVRIGALTFGGGYAMLPMLERECVEKYGWVSREELLNYFAISQCTPGVIAVNTATFVGAKQRGVAGSAAATVGVVLPSLVIIALLAALLENFAHLPAVQHAFAGIRTAVLALILNTVVKLLKASVKRPVDVCLCIAAFVLVAAFSLSPVFVVVGAALVGLAVRPKPADGGKGEGAA